MDIVRIFGSHQGNIGSVGPEGRVVIDIDRRSGGLESLVAMTGRYGPFPETPAGLTGGNGFHNYLLLPSWRHRPLRRLAGLLRLPRHRVEGHRCSGGADTLGPRFRPGLPLGPGLRPGRGAHSADSRVVA